MADAITEAIQNSMAEAGLTGDEGGLVVDESADSSTDDTSTTETTETSSADESGDGSSEPIAASAETSPSAVTEPVKDDATLKRDAELAELGLVAPKPGQKENRLPHSRVVKMVDKAETRVRTEMQGEISKRDSQIAELNTTAQEFRRLNMLAEQSPERFIEALAVANPQVWKPIQARLAGAPVAASASKPAEAAAPSLAGKPRPQPNVKLADGSLTYDEQGLDQLLQWTTDNAVARATESVTRQFEDRFGPLEQTNKTVQEQQRAEAWRREQGPRIQKQIADARAEWGPLFEADYQKAEAGGKSDILTYMAEHKVSFERACTAVLLPKLRAERNKIRAEIITELNERPAASAETRTAVKEPTGPRTMEQVIKESMTAAGLR